MRPFKPTSKRPHSPIDEELFLRAARTYFLRRFPNPDRKGCPTTDEIGAMARHEIPQSNLAGRAEHIATCSSCLSEYLAAHEKWKRRRLYWVAALAAAAVLILGFVGISWLRSPDPGPTLISPTSPDVGQPDTQQQVATLDLRPFEVTRGERPAQPPAPVLTRANLRLTILLPVGSEEGNYQFEIRDEQDVPRIRGTALAVIRDYITTIETVLDLRPLNAGSFTLVIRQTDESSWRSYGLEVQ